MNKKMILVYSTFCILLPLAYFIQTQLFLSPDISYLLYVTKIMLNAGKYANDFIETNPPMILYLSAPACLLGKYTGLSTLLLFRLYVLTLILISVGLSIHMLNKIIKPHDQIIFYCLTFMLLFVLLFLPLFSFGQREHFLMIFMMPYLFTAILELENKVVRWPLALFSGLFAGLGFGIKPFFLMPFALIEFYFMFKKRNIFAWVRIEPLAICSVILIYLLSIHLYQPQYLNIILPLVLRYYFISAIEPWMDTMTHPLVQFCVLGCISYFLFNKHDNYRTLNTILFLALLGTMIAFIIPRTPWYYHLLPAFGFSLLITASYLGQIISASYETTSNAYLKNIVILLCAATLMYIIPFVATYRYFQRYNNSYWLVSNKKLASYIQRFPGNNSVYCFTTLGSSDCFPLLFNLNKQLGGRFHFFWWYTGLRKREQEQHSPEFLAQLENDKHYLINIIANDLNHYQTKWIIVNTYSFKNWDQESLILSSENTLYRDAWKHYHYTTTIDNYRIYTRDSL